jgi:uncharacterized membrane protein (DUF485 family)
MLKRKRFALSIVGISFVLISGLVTIISYAITEYGGYVAWGMGLAFGLPPALLSILSIIFVAVSKNEFD